MYACDEVCGRKNQDSNLHFRQCRTTSEKGAPVVRAMTELAHRRDRGAGTPLRQGSWHTAATGELAHRCDTAATGELAHRRNLAATAS